MIFEISAKNGLCDVILGSTEKTSDLAAHFSRNSGAASIVLFTIQTFNEYSSSGVATGGGGQAGQLAPPTSDRTPREIDANPRIFSYPKKWG